MALPGTTATYLGKSFLVQRYLQSAAMLPEQDGMMLHGVLTSAELIQRAPEAELNVHAVLDVQYLHYLFQHYQYGGR